MSSFAQTAPGGFIETLTSAQTRARLDRTQIQSFVPVRGNFRFPAPWNTEAVRLTNETDCGSSSDCVHAIGYSYWRNINNHTGSDTLYLFLGLNRSRGGQGPTLFSYNKTSGVLAKVGPLFDSNSSYSWHSGEGWYFSATLPTKIYMNDGPRMLRYDVFSHQFETVFDVRTTWGNDKVIWQMHSSNDDRVHSVTLRSDDSGGNAMLGCLVYREDTRQFSWFPRIGDYDECQIDRSGRWLVIKENVDSADGEDNRIIDLQNGTERRLLDRNGAGGHSDMGAGYMIAADNWASLANTMKVWPLTATTLSATTAYYNYDWNTSAPNHVSHTNAKIGIAASQQYACGSSANRRNAPHANEIICFHPDASGQVLVVAPVMTDLDASGGGDDYGKMPKGNLDVTGNYFIWTSNLAGGRLDAFLVKVPGQLLTGTSNMDTTIPVVTITAPGNGAQVNGTVTVSANATDNNSISGVQFRLDGANLGAEDTSAPYSVAWNTGALSGTHVLTAVARDAAGNTSTSSAVSVTVAASGIAPLISGIGVQSVASGSATIVWTTDTASDSQVEYGTSSTYGRASSLNSNLVTAHSQSLSGLTAGTLYHYRVKSRDSAGRISISGDYTFSTPAAATADRTAPIVAITTPSNNQSGLTGKVTVAASASDNLGIVGVQFRVDGVNLGAEDRTPPYAVTWDTSLAGSGSYKLRAIARDAAGNKTASSVINVTVATASSGSETSQAATWTSLVNVTAGSNLLHKTSGCDGCADAGAVSQQQISGNGYVEFTATVEDRLRFIGLGDSSTGTSATDIDFGLRLQGTVLEVRENGNYRWDTGITAGDLLRIEVKSGVVSYARNGSVIYTSKVVPASLLRVDTSFNSINAGLANVRIVDN